MPDMTPQDWADAALRRGLHDLDVPEPSPDFDARVLSAVRGRSPLREVFLSYLRPALATAAASAVVTLLLVHWATRPAVSRVEAADVPPMEHAEAVRRGEALSARLLESPRAAYLALWKMEAG